MTKIPAKSMLYPMANKVLIVADIEGSTGCFSYEDSQLKTETWPRACIDLSLDIKAVSMELLQQGVDQVYIKDFHRTGFNILPELIDDDRVKVIHGYKAGPVPGIGDTFGCQTAFFIGMHAASGTEGFLPHTLTSRYSAVRVNGSKVSELELFASSLYWSAVIPLFFSGCRRACDQAKEAIPNLLCNPIPDKGKKDYDIEKSRRDLAEGAGQAWKEYERNKDSFTPYRMKGPFSVEIELAENSERKSKSFRKWKLKERGNSFSYSAETFDEMYEKLLDVSYLTPMVKRFLSPGLFIFRMYGNSTLSWLRRRLKKMEMVRL